MRAYCVAKTEVSLSIGSYPAPHQPTCNATGGSPGHSRSLQASPNALRPPASHQTLSLRLATARGRFDAHRRLNVEGTINRESAGTAQQRLQRLYQKWPKSIFDEQPSSVICSIPLNATSSKQFAPSNSKRSLCSSVCNVLRISIRS